MSTRAQLVGEGEQGTEAATPSHAVVCAFSAKQRGRWALQSGAFESVCLRAGSRPQHDAFAARDNAKCATFWSESNDAFAHDWQNEQLLWINPPFARAHDVVEKLKREQNARALLLLPPTPSYDRSWLNEHFKWFDVDVDETSFLPESTAYKRNVGTPPWRCVRVWRVRC